MWQACLNNCWEMPPRGRPSGDDRANGRGVGGTLVRRDRPRALVPPDRAVGVKGAGEQEGAADGSSVQVAPVPAVSPDIMSPDMAGPAVTSAAAADVAGTDTSVPQPRLSDLDTADAALLDTLLREAPVGFALLGPDLCFRRINDTLARLHGHDPDEHIGRSPADLWPAESAAQAESAARRVLSEDQPVFESG